MCFEKNILEWYFVFRIYYSEKIFCLPLFRKSFTYETFIPESSKIIKDNSSIKNVRVQKEKYKGAARNTQTRVANSGNAGPN